VEAQVVEAQVAQAAMAAVVKAQRLAVPQVVATAETGAATAVDVTAAVMVTAAETTVRRAAQWAPTPVPILALLIALPIPMPHGAMVTSDSVPQIAAAGKQKRIEYAVRAKTPISIFNTFIALIPTFLKRGKEICLQRRR
jgi:hypothetical protein